MYSGGEGGGGNWKRKQGIRKQGTRKQGNKEQGTRNKERGTRDKETRNKKTRKRMEKNARGDKGHTEPGLHRQYTKKYILERKI